MGLLDKMVAERQCLMSYSRANLFKSCVVLVTVDGKV